MPEQQLELPYQIIDKIEGKTFVRDNYDGSFLRAFKIAFKDIKRRDGFNVRRNYKGLRELADSIAHEGQKTPFDLVVTKDGAFIKRGHNRHDAYMLLIEEKKFDPATEVLFFPVQPDETEEDMVVDLHTSNLAERLDLLGEAEVARRLKVCFGNTHEKIAEKMKMSRQRVDQLIKIGTASDEIKNEIYLADMGIVDAIKLIDKGKKSKKDAEQAELDANKNTAGKTATPYDPNAEELAELKAMEEKQPGEVDEETGEVRMTNPELKEYESKGLDLVGNTVATTPEKKEKDGTVNYDEERPEIAQIQNCIKLNDRLGVRVEKLAISDGDKKDLLDWLKWQMKDLEEARTWIHSNKKQNKIR